MTLAIQQELSDPRTVLYSLTVGQYQRLIADGVLAEGEPFELLDGNVVRKDRSHAGDDPTTVGHEHALAVMKLTNLNPQLQKLGCHLRPQQPLTLPPHDEPEPDAAIVAGRAEDYADRHPGAKDVSCVIEVADSSLRRDRTTKLRIYADGGIAQYLIVNLPERVIEVHSEPQVGKGRYAKRVVLKPRSSIQLPTAGKSLGIPARQVLP